MSNGQVRPNTLPDAVRYLMEIAQRTGLTGQRRRVPQIIQLARDLKEQMGEFDDPQDITPVDTGLEVTTVEPEVVEEVPPDQEEMFEPGLTTPRRLHEGTQAELEPIGDPATSAAANLAGQELIENAIGMGKTAGLAGLSTGFLAKSMRAPTSKAVQTGFTGAAKNIASPLNLLDFFDHLVGAGLKSTALAEDLEDSTSDLSAEYGKEIFDKDTQTGKSDYEAFVEQMADIAKSTKDVGTFAPSQFGHYASADVYNDIAKAQSMPNAFTGLIAKRVVDFLTGRGGRSEEEMSDREFAESLGLDYESIQEVASSPGGAFGPSTDLNPFGPGEHPDPMGGDIAPAGRTQQPDKPSSVIDALNELRGAHTSGKQSVGLGLAGSDPSEVTDSKSPAKNEQFTKEHRSLKGGDSPQSGTGSRSATNTRGITEGDPEAMSGCIIVTACTHPDSLEVNITREYRDKYLNKTTLGGYYAIAHLVVPIIQKSERFKIFVKKYLVDRWIDHAGVKLGYRKFHRFKESPFISKLFLKLCTLVGTIISNGDELIAMHR